MAKKDTEVTQESKADNEAAKPENTKEADQHHEDAGLPSSDPGESNETEASVEESSAQKSTFRTRISKIADKIKAHKLATGIVVALLVAAVVVMATELKYSVANAFWSPIITVEVLDEATTKPVVGVEIAIGEFSAETNNVGIAELEADYGTQTLRAEREAYANYSADYLIDFGANDISFSLEPTGTEIGVAVLNYVSGEPVAGVQAASGAENTVGGETDEEGELRYLVDAQPGETSTVTLTKDGFNPLETEIEVELEGDNTALQLVPSGKDYYFSNRSGKINFYSSNLDGSDEQILLEATGSEREDISLAISPNAKWAAIISTRSGERHGNGSLKEKLYILNLESGELVDADEGNATFDLVDWTGETIVYKARVYEGDNLQEYKETKLKTYDASSRQIATLDVFETIGFVEVINEKIIYSLQDWYGDGSQVKLANISNGSDKVLIDDYMYSVSRPNREELLFSGYFDDREQWFAFNLNSEELTELDGAPARLFNRDFFSNDNGEQVAWVERRDGQDRLLTAEADGSREQVQVGLQSISQSLRWVNNRYIIFRSLTNETADYIVDTQTESKPKKIKDVFNSESYRYYY